MKTFCDQRNLTYIMDINRRLLSDKLKKVGTKSTRFEVIRKSSEKTLDTIDETVESSFSSMKDFMEEGVVGAGEDNSIIHTDENDLDNCSFPSLEWTQHIEEIVPYDQQQQQQQQQGSLIKERGLYPKPMIRQALNRRSWGESTSSSSFGQETLGSTSWGELTSDSSGSFEQIGVLYTLSANRYNENTIHAKRRLALRTRESQLRRIMYQLQGGEGHTHWAQEIHAVGFPEL